MDKTITFLVEDTDKNLRLDKFLSGNLNNFTRSQLKKIIISKGVKIDNKIVVSASEKVKSGNVIKILIKAEENNHIKPKRIKLDVVYEDKELILINKPSGLTVHPGAGNKENTLVNGLMSLYKKNLSSLNGPFRPGIVHRIDKETSGLLVVAKNNFTHANLTQQFSEHSISRKYLALIWGITRPLVGKIETLITRNKKNRQLMSVSDIRGKKSVTHYKTIKTFNIKDVPKISLMEFTLETGRTHQIRVHMAFKRNPILGDKQYGKKNIKFKKINKEFEKTLKLLNRQALHAKTIGFVHPRQNKFMSFDSDLPKDFKKMLDLLNKLSN
mgnify:CR=1 FL=1